MKKKPFLYSIIFSLIIFILGMVTPYHLILSGIAGALALILLLSAGLFSGAFVSGDRNRANYWMEDKKGRETRVNSGLALFLLGGPLLVVCIVLFAIYY